VCAPASLNVVTVHFDTPCWRELATLGGKAALESRGRRVPRGTFFSGEEKKIPRV